MSVVSDYIKTKKNEQLQNIKYFENLRDKEPKETIDEFIKEAQKTIALYDRLVSDKAFSPLKQGRRGQRGAIDILIDEGGYPVNHLSILIDACLEYYHFIDSGVSEKHYNRDITALKERQKEVLKMIDSPHYTGTLQIEIPQSPTMIREQLLSNLTAVGQGDKYTKILQYLPITGTRKPKWFTELEYNKRSEYIAHSNGKTITYTVTVKIPLEN